MMNSYLRTLFGYFENVLHPASGWDTKAEKRKRKSIPAATSIQVSPESFNVRGVVKKQDQYRKNPAP